jgi:hypothetical protein
MLNFIETIFDDNEDQIPMDDDNYNENDDAGKKDQNET